MNCTRTYAEKRFNNELIGLIDRAVKAVGKTYLREIEDDEITYNGKTKRYYVSVLYDGDRGSFSDFFTPRPHEEDDDWPEFTARRKIEKYLEDRLGKSVSINVWDHEKGLFSVSIGVEHETINS